MTFHYEPVPWDPDDVYPVEDWEDWEGERPDTPPDMDQEDLDRRLEAGQYDEALA